MELKLCESFKLFFSINSHIIIGIRGSNNIADTVG